MTYDSKREELKGLMTNIEYVKYTLNSLVYWDKVTYMPSEGIEYRSKVMAYMADQQYQMLSDSKFTSLVGYFRGNAKNDRMMNSMIKRIERSASYVNKIPADEYGEYIKLIAISEQIWEKARKENDFQRFKPYLEKIVKTFKNFADYWGYQQDPYDALLGHYEEGLTVREMDDVVESVKEHLITMMEQVNKERAPGEKEVIIAGIDVQQQMKLWTLLLNKIGFDFEAGRLDIGSHATILFNSPKDVRIVNDYQEGDIRTGIFNVLHSGGKGVYQQSIDEALMGTFLAESPSFALEEAIGRFYENVIGRSRGFWESIYPEVIEIIPQIGEVGLDTFFRSINDYQATSIRLDADELTYLIHIIIRYEIEKDLINGRLSVEDLQTTWNNKYETYLGVKPLQDSMGVLQDIHWAAGYIGYFPGYFISNLTAAQLATAIEKEEGSLNSLMLDKGLERINQWMKKHIYFHGAKYTFSELLLNSTGETLNAEHYIDYLRNKISEVYNNESKGEEE